MYPSGPDINLKEKKVFVEEEAGVVMASDYMQCLLDYLRGLKNIDIFEETEVVSIQNDKNGVNLSLKSKGNITEIRSKKAALSGGRWISKLIPSLSQILTPIRQIVTYW